MLIHSKLLDKLSYMCLFKNHFLGLAISTLVYLIIVQDGINMQDGKISKIDECAVGNKAVQIGIFQKLLL